MMLTSSAIGFEPTKAVKNLITSTIIYPFRTCLDSECLNVSDLLIELTEKGKGYFKEGYVELPNS